MGAEWRFVSEVPFAKHCSPVTGSLEDLRHGERVWAQALPLLHDMSNHALGPAKAAWVGAGKESHAGRGAYRCSSIEAGELDSLPRQLIKNGSFDFWMTI